MRSFILSTNSRELSTFTNSKDKTGFKNLKMGQVTRQRPFCGCVLSVQAIAGYNGQPEYYILKTSVISCNDMRKDPGFKNKGDLGWFVSFKVIDNVTFRQSM